MRELLFAFLATRPQFARAKSCRRELVGPMRQYLWRHGAAHENSPDAMWADAPPRALALLADRIEASEMLADFCARCGRCAWSGNRGVMTAPPEPETEPEMEPDTDPDADHGR